MKRISLFVLMALVAALALCLAVGCSAQQSQEEIIAELKDAVAKAPEFKSVTVNETIYVTQNEPEAAAGEEANAEAAAGEDANADAAAGEEANAQATEGAAESAEAAAGDKPNPEATEGEAAAGEEAADDSAVVDSQTTFKFDSSSGTLKTSMDSKVGDIVMKYYSDGDKAVCVTDGPVYSGTPEQFDMVHFAGYEAYVNEQIGDLNTLIDCASTVEKGDQDGMTVYSLTLDPQKYIQTDEALTVLAEAGDSVKEAALIIGIDPDGNIVMQNLRTVLPVITTEVNLQIGDFDTTTIDPMPKADKTYEQMEADLQAKYDEAFESINISEEDKS